MKARTIARPALRGWFVVILWSMMLQALAYELIVTPRTQFNVSNGPAEYNFEYFANGQSSYVKKLSADPYSAAQYTLTRFIVVPQSGDLSRVEDVDVQMTFTSQLIGTGPAVVHVWTVSPFATLYEFVEPTTQTLHLKTNVLYQSEAIAGSNSFPGEQLVELRFAVPLEVLPPDLPRVALGEWHTCVVRADQSAACWGLNDLGQSSPPSGAFRQIAGGWIHSCGLKMDGTLVCWGHNGQGRATPPAGTFVQVTSGRHHSCALRTDGTVACWGENQFGQAAPPTGTFKYVGAGQQHTCGVRSDDSLVCWGANFDGQASPPSGSFKQVSGGLFHSCGLRTDGTLACWGVNDFGQASPPGGIYEQLDSGWHFNCALRPDKTIACWGTNQDGQLNVPAGTYKQVDAGLWHTCAVRTDDTLTCWGDNSRGQAPHTVLQPAVLPSGETGSAYDRQLALEGTPGYSPPAAGFEIIGGNLPPGLSMDVLGHISGVPTSAGSFSFTVEGIDANGFSASRAYTLEVAIGDSTPPIIQPVVTGSLGASGWYVGTVTIAWQVFDDESGVTSSTGCTIATLSSDTSSAGFTCTATSAGGTSSESVTVKRDATPPVLAPEVSPTIILLHGSGSVVAHASDALSGLATEECAVLETGTIGTHAASCTATDAAGNTTTATANYTVIYGFVGFTPPVDNPPAVNVAKAGQTIPFKWRLVDAAGAPVSNLGGVTLAIIPISCDSNAPLDEVEQYVSGGSAFFNRGGGDYQYNWQTSKSFVGMCKKVVIDLGDGSSRYALFRFR